MYFISPGPPAAHSWRLEWPHAAFVRDAKTGKKVFVMRLLAEMGN